MIESPLAGNTDLVSFSVKIDGQPLRDTVSVLQLYVHKEVNRIASARITLLDGDPSSEDFVLSDSAEMTPGGTITLSAGYAGTETVLFEGIIVKHGLRVRADGRSTLVLSCFDKAVKLTQGRKSASLGKTDSDTMQALIEGAGLAACVEATSATHDGQVRYHATDWDFIVCRAEVNGKIVLTDDGKVSVCAPVCAGTPVLRIAYGDALQEIDAEIDARTQYQSVECASWDFTQQEVIRASSSEPGVNRQGNLSGQAIAGALGLPAFCLHSSTPMPGTELKTWADAQLLKSRLARVRGSVSFRGNARPKPGCLIELGGLGDRFDGEAFVSRVVHRLEEGDWTTEIGFGLAPRWFVEEAPDVAAPLASNLLPGVQGLLNGVVRKIDADPDGQARVQVDVPMIGLEGEGIWARLASGYATDRAGIFFMPEVGDEVILGFLNGNPGYPIVLGSLYSSKRNPPCQPDAVNKNKAIVTRAQLKITMDDATKCLQIETPGGHVVTLNDEDQSVTIKDSNGSKLHFAPAGITLESQGDITIKAGGNLNLGATAALGVDAGTKLEMAAPQISANAAATLSLQGQLSAEMTSSGQATVRASLVMIN